MKLKMCDYEKISLISGFLITFVFGSLYTLGTITPYIASYIHYLNDSSIYAADVSILYPTYMVSQVVGIVLSMNFLQKWIGYRLLCFIGVYGMVLCVFITSFCSSFAGFLLFYGGFFGFFVGFCYLIPTLNCYEYLPKKKGLSAGVCMMAFGVGSLTFNIILLQLINPSNQEQNDEHLFPIDVAQNVPRALRYMSLIYAGIGTVGCLLMIPKTSLHIQNPPHTENSNYQTMITEVSQEKRPQKLQQQQFPQKDQLKKPQNPKFRDLLKTIDEYKYLFLMILLSLPFGAFIAFNYKEYGQTLTQDDELITLVGSLGAISNSLSRIFWCWLFDKYSWKKIILILNTTQIFYLIAIIFVKNFNLYIILVILVYFSYGANYGMYPTQTVRIYGSKDGSRIYPLTFSAFSIASVVQFLLHYFIVKKMGDAGFFLCFLFFGIFLVIAEILFLAINFKYRNQNDSKSAQKNKK